MKDLLARIYFVYGMLLFALTMIPVALFFWIVRTLLPERIAGRCIQYGFQVWMGIYLPLVGCPVSHAGRHYFRRNQTYVVVMNHNSLADVPVSSPGIPGPNKTLAKIEMARIPIFGYIYKSGSILVARNDMRSRVESFHQMIQALQKGFHLCLFPEGTRNKSTEPLGDFQDGAFKVAIKAQKPVIPALIFGTRNILHPDKKFWAWPHRIRLHFLPEISTEGLTLAEAETLKQQVYQQMKSHYLQHPEWV